MKKKNENSEEDVEEILKEGTEEFLDEDSEDKKLRIALNEGDDENTIYLASSDDVETTMKIKRAREEWDEEKED